MKNSRYIFLVAVFLIFFFGVNAQTDSTLVKEEPKQEVQNEVKPKSSARDKIYFGGNIGLSLGTYTSIGVYPLIGYKITPKFSVGAQLSYQYVNDKRFSENYDYSNYGGSLFARYRIIPPLYAHIEYAAMNYESYNALGESSRIWVPYLFAGAGYSQKVGNNTWVNFQILFDLLQDSNSPYNDWEPFYSIGVGVGF